MEIPKVIHYCWFGKKPLPELAIKCIKSWKDYLPDYEIKRWDESNFDIRSIPYISQAYDAKKYAFVSDYARFWILYNYGGLYFDTDVEVINNMDAIIQSGSFIGCEGEYNSAISKTASGWNLGVNPGLGLGAPCKLPIFKEILDLYQKLTFSSTHLTTVVTYVTNILCNHGLKNLPDIQEIEGLRIYPKDYFCPKDYESGEIILTQNTVSIHHYDASWHGPLEKIYNYCCKLFGKSFMRKIISIFR